MMIRMSMYVMLAAVSISLAACQKDDNDTKPSQEEYIYRPFLVDGKVWINEEPSKPDGPGQDPLPETITFIISGDTIFHGVNCKKVYRRRTMDNGVEVTYFHTGLIEQEKKIYRVATDGSLTLLYDFGMKVGDSIAGENGPYSLNIMPKTLITLVNEDYVNICGEHHRRMLMKINTRFNKTNIWSEDHYDTWIEGIGGTHGFLTFLARGDSTYSSESQYKYFLKSCYEDDRELFNWNDYLGTTTNK